MTDSELDVVKELTAEEWDLAERARTMGGRQRSFLKCRYPEGGIFYLVTDGDGGYQADSIQELREFLS
jgi:hypothetical protein